MKRIGITQRVVHIEAYNEYRDALDHAWVDLFLKLGYLPVVLPNLSDAGVISEYLDACSLDGVVLTGGNNLSQTQTGDISTVRDAFESTLIDYCLSNNLPILGVCRGMQMLNVFFGGKIVPVDGHVCADHLIRFKNNGAYHVNSYHELGVSQNQNWPVRCKLMQLQLMVL